jgi:hypothetical protein
MEIDNIQDWEIDCYNYGTLFRSHVPSKIEWKMYSSGRATKVTMISGYEVNSNGNQIYGMPIHL